jgi:probable HAF family extracellular repeat protein
VSLKYQRPTILRLGLCRNRVCVAVVGLLLIASVGCSDRLPLNPPGSSPQLAVVESPDSTAMLDCAVLTVQRLPGNQVSAAIEATAECPSILKAQLGSIVLRPHAGRPMDPMRLTVRLKNTSSEHDLGREVGITADLASASVLRGSKTVAASGYLVPANADRIETTAGLMHGSATWIYGQELDAEKLAPAHLFESGETSGERTIEFEVHPSVKSFRIPLRMYATGMLYRGLAATVPTGSGILASAVHKEGSRLAVFGSSKVDGAVFVAPSGQSVTVWVGDDGKPIRAVFPGMVVLFSNWTAGTVDMAVVQSDSAVRVFRGVAVASVPINALNSRLGQSVRASLTIDPFMLEALLRSGAAAVSAASCGAWSLAALGTGGLAVPMALATCGSFLLESVGTLSPEFGDSPITKTSVSTLQGIGCAIEAIDAVCWGDVLQYVLEQMADNEWLLEQLAGPVGTAESLLRSGANGGLLELGTLGGSESNALDINLGGQIVGYSTRGDGTTRAFLWTPAGGLQDLGTLGGCCSTANAINDRGEVVGTSQTLSGIWHAFKWSAATGMQDLGGFNSSATDLNEAGTVVGTDNIGGSPRAFVWTAAGGRRYLAVPMDGGTSAASGINNSGAVVGWTANCFTCTAFATYWSDIGAMQQIHPPFFGYNRSEALDINDLGQVVGYAYGSRARAFIWPSPDGHQPACALSGGEGRAQGINRSGIIVGSGSTSFSTSPVFTRSVRCPLNQDTGLELPRGTALEGAAEKINEAGFVVGSIRDAQGHVRAVRWSPP